MELLLLAIIKNNLEALTIYKSGDGVFLNVYKYI